MALMDIVMRDRAEIFVGRILVEAVTLFLPADMVIKLTHLMLNFCI
jgi:hypothetical protein